MENIKKVAGLTGDEKSASESGSYFQCHFSISLVRLSAKTTPLLAEPEKVAEKFPTPVAPTPTPSVPPPPPPPRKPSE